MGAAEKGGEQGCNLWRFQVPARDLPARAGLHGAARQRAGKGPLSTPSRACHTHGVSSGPGSGPGCRHVGGGGDGPGHVWPSCWGPLHGWAVLQARTPNMQPPPPHPASTRDEGACLPAWALYVDWRLYHYEYELPPVCLLGVAAVGVCRRSRHFFSVADCQLAVHPLLAVPCLFAAPLASAVAQQTTAHHPAARGAGVPVTRLGRLLRPPPALPQPQHNQPRALLANDAPLAPLGPARLSGIV